MADLMRCASCAGSVVYDVKAEAVACLFCGSIALEAAPPDEPIPIPDGAIPLEVDRAQADREYRAWAQRSWWYPNKLRHLSIEIRPMLLPAWRFVGDLETHWSGLVKAATRSGKRPVSGTDAERIQHMVPASQGLGQDELTDLQPWSEGDVGGWSPGDEHLPYEPPALSERGARIRAHADMGRHHLTMIEREQGLVSSCGSWIVEDVDVKLFMLPIYIGAFRFRDRPWRFVINAQSGEVVGKAPIDMLKVALVVLGVLAVILAVVVLVSR